MLGSIAIRGPLPGPRLPKAGSDSMPGRRMKLKTRNRRGNSRSWYQCPCKNIFFV